MKKIMSLLLALTMILSVGSLMASAAATEVTNATTIEPTNYGQVGVATVKGMANKTSSSVFTDTADNNSLNTGTDCLSLQGINNNSRETNNTFFVVKLTNEQYVSALVVDQYKSRIKQYRIFATSDEELGEEVFTAAGTDKGLTERGKVHKKKGLIEGTTNKYEVKETIKYDNVNEVYTIDKLYAADALVASGTLAPDDAVTTEKNVFYFNEPVKAKYIIFVVDSTLALNNGTPIDCIEVLGTTESNSTDITQYPKTVINYADKSVYPDVESVASKFLTDSEKEVTSYGLPSVLVDPNATTKPNGVSDPAFMLSNANTYKTTSGTPVGAAVSTPNSWIAIDFGEERTIDTVEIYQWKNRIKSVEVYELITYNNTYGYDTVKANGGLNPSDSFYANYTRLIGSATFDHGTNTGTELNVGSLNNPDVINLGREVTCEGILIKVTEVVSSGSGVIMRRIMAKNYSKPIISYENAYPENGINYTTKFVNDTNATKKYAVIEAQYNNADEMIASNIKYVNIEPLYTKSFAGEITKLDGAKTIKVFSVCLDNLAPLETQYTFNIQ